MSNPFDELVAALASLQAVIDDLSSRVQALETATPSGLSGVGVVQQTSTVTITGTGHAEAEVTVPAGKVALSGGSLLVTDSSPPSALVLRSSNPTYSGSPPVAHGWRVTYQDTRASFETVDYGASIIVYAIYATGS